MGSHFGFPIKRLSMRTLLYFGIFTILAFNLKSQQIYFGTGFELNQTRFRQFAPTVTVPFKNPHGPGFGLSAYFFFEMQLTNKISVNLSPIIGFYNTNSNVTDDFQLGIYGLRFSPKLKLKKIDIELGIEYNRLQSLIGTLPNGRKIDWTFFAHKRDLFGPNIDIGYWFKNTKIHFRSTYFLHDFLRSGALDYDGNIVGPVEVTPFVIALGLDFNLTQIVKNSKAGKYKRKAKE